MPQTVITVAGIAPPAVGKKQGKITDTTGGVWNVWGDKVQNYRIGVSYEIVYEQGEFNGNPFKLIKSANPSNAPAAVQPQPAHQVLHASGGGPGGVSHGPLQQSFSNKDEMIFVCGALNNAMANPNVAPFQMTAIEIATFVKLLRQVWRGTLGATPATREMDDDIPF